MGDQRDARLLRFGRRGLQSAEPLAGKCIDLPGDVLRDRRKRIVLLNLDPHDPRRLGRAIAAGEGRAEGDGNLTEDRSGKAPAERALDPVERFDDFDPAGENRKERRLSAFRGGELASGEMDVGRRLREALQFGGRQGRKQGDRCNVLNRQHSHPQSVIHAAAYSFANQARSRRPRAPEGASLAPFASRE